MIPPKTANSCVVKIYGTLGAGACSQVYACSVDGWICAMKEVAIDTEEAPKAYCDEIEILSKIPKHDNLIRFLSYRKTETSYQIFLQQYHGSLDGNIAQRKKDEKFFTPLEIVTILADVVSGLLCLHSNNIIHRG